MTVVVYHFRNQVMFGTVPGVEMVWFENLSLAVDLFFVISGIVITFAYQQLHDVRGFLQKRFARLAPLHYATLCFYLVAGYLAMRSGVAWSEGWKYRPDCLLGNVAFLQAFGTCDRYAFNHVSWSVSAEMAMYLLFPLLLPLQRRSPAIPLILAAIWIVGASVAHQLLPQFRVWHAMTHDFGVVRAVPGFLIGMGLWGYRDQLARIPRPGMVMIAIVALLLIGLSIGVARGALLPLVYALPAAALAADRGQRASPLVARIAPYGALTYGIYMLHPLIRSVGMPVLGAIGLSDTAAIAICFLAVLPVAYLVYFLFEQPMRRLLSPRRKVKTVAAA